MTLNWRAAPFIRLLIPFIIGIWIAFSFNLPLSPLWLFFPFMFLFFLHLRKTPSRQKWYFGILLYAFLVLLGWSLGSEQLRQFRPEALFDLKGEAGWFQGWVLDLSQGEERMRLGLKLEEGFFPEKEQLIEGGRLLLYVPNTDQQFRVGDQIQFQGRLMLIPSPKNPKAFDFAAYMQSEGYFYQVFVKEGDWKYLPDAKAAFLRRRAEQLRQHCLHILRHHLPTADEYAIGAALITGERTALSPEIKAGYSGTGAMHVLAVSGLHVGLIYLGLQFLLGLFKLPHYYWKWTKTGLLLLGIWSFAYFTGATASVIRAACMFSFLLIGQSLKRYTNIYNTIAASAFCMLLVHPILLFNIGFQLSYLALLGIVYFQDIIYKSWYIPHPTGAYLWKLSSVALAAQLATLPISLYYFHQFPVYFLLSGLVVVPAAMVILSAGLALFLFHSVPFIGFLLGKILYGCIWGMNAFIFFLQQLPGSTIQGIWINKAMLVTLFLSVFALGAFLLVRKRRFLYWVAGLLVLFSSQLAAQAWQNHQRREIVIYHSKDQTIVDCIDGRTCLRITGQAIDNSALEWTVGNYQGFTGIKTVTQIGAQDTLEGKTWFYQNGFLQFHHVRLALLDSLPYASSDSPLKLDYVLLRDNPSFRLQDLQRIFNPDQVVWDGSNSFWKSRDWAKMCEEAGVEYVDVRGEGALVIGL